MSVRSALYYRRGSGGKVAIEDMSVSTGQRLFVDSTNSAAADSTAMGFTPDKPLATLDYAVGRCNAGKGDIIYLMPGHNENIGNAQIDLDVQGISVIGLGVGTLRPRFDFDHANASIDIGAADVTVRNIRLLPSVTAVLIGIDVEAGVTDAKLIDIEIMPGEDAGDVDEFTTGIEFKAGCNRGLVKGLIARTQAADASAQAIMLKGASDQITIEDCVIRGNYSAACIFGDTTLSTNLLIRNCILQPKNTEPGIEVLTLTTGIVANCYIATDLAAKADAIAGTGGAHALYLFENYYCEVVGETGGIIGTASADD